MLMDEKVDDKVNSDNEDEDVTFGCHLSNTNFLWQASRGWKSPSSFIVGILRHSWIYVRGNGLWSVRVLRFIQDPLGVRIIVDTAH